MICIRVVQSLHYYRSSSRCCIRRCWTSGAISHLTCWWWYWKMLYQRVRCFRHPFMKQRNSCALGLGYIHACKYDCALFLEREWKFENCSKYGEWRYKRNDNKGNKIPNKVLHYFPLIPRLQRLYMSRKIAKDMSWHKEKRVNDRELLRHPSMVRSGKTLIDSILHSPGSPEMWG